MRKTVCVLAALLLAANIAWAAPQVEVPSGGVNIEYAYSGYTGQSFSPSGQDVSGQVNGRTGQYTITYGLSSGFAFNVGLGFRPGIYSNGPQSGSVMEITDLQLQKHVHRNVATFVGIKTFDESPDLPYLAPAYSVAAGNQSRDELEVGLIGQAKISNRISSYTKVGMGKDLAEYKVGFAYKMSNVYIDVGYSYQAYNKAQADSKADGPEVVNQGAHLGVNCKF